MSHLTCKGQLGDDKALPGGFALGESEVAWPSISRFLLAKPERTIESDPRSRGQKPVQGKIVPFSKLAQGLQSQAAI